MTAGYTAGLPIIAGFLRVLALNHSDVEAFGVAIANACAGEDLGLKNLRARRSYAR